MVLYERVKMLKGETIAAQFLSSLKDAAGEFHELYNRLPDATFNTSCILANMHNIRRIVCKVRKKIEFWRRHWNQGMDYYRNRIIFNRAQVSFKMILSDFESSYEAQVARYLLGIIGSTILLFGVFKYYHVVKNMYWGV